MPSSAAIMERARLTLNVAVLGLCLISLGCDEKGDGQLSLVESWAITLPHGFVMSGAVGGDGHDIIVWSSVSGAVVRLDRRGILETLDSANFGERLHPVSAGGSAEEFEIMDRTGLAYRLRHGILLDTTRVPMSPGEELAAATFADGQWKLALKTASALRLIDLSCSPPTAEDECPEFERRELALITNRQPPLDAHLVSVDRGLLVSFVNQPFTGMAVYKSGNVAISDAGLPEQDLLPAPGESPSWAALPIIQTEGAFIQILADIRSDHRVLVRRRLDGTLVQTSTVEAPIGLVGWSQATGEIYGSRAIDGIEFVAYNVRISSNSRAQ